MSNHVQVLLYTSYLHDMGGIETFIYDFIELMKNDIQIGVLCPRLPDDVAKTISLNVMLYRGKEAVSCDTLIMVRQSDEIPAYVKYQDSKRMCHSYRSNITWNVKQDCGMIIHVSKASKRSYGIKGAKVIYNPLIKTDKEALLLISATRIPALDKGKNAERMIKLARKLNENKIRFMWMNFSDAPLQGAPKGFVNVGKFEDLQPFIAKADYLVQLSDQEGFGYSVLEALVNNTAVICTPFETTKELGVVDGENGYIIPYDLDFDVKKLLQVPEFEYSYEENNERIRKNWMKILSTRKVVQEEPDTIPVRVRVQYSDMALNRSMSVGEILRMPRKRALYLESRKLVTIIKDP